MHPLYAGLATFIDYAGLFPPAGLDLTRTIANHAAYAGSAEAWMLGRLVVPAARLEEVARRLAEGAPQHPQWRIAALVGTAEGLDAAAAAVDRFDRIAGGTGVTVTAIEAAPREPREVAELATVFPSTLERFAEIPLDETRDIWLDAIAAAGCCAKIRAGGLTEDRFPSSAAVAAVLHACASRHVPLKATAGLHHPLRAAYRLTYEPGSPSGVMHGFINLLAAALLLHTGDGTQADAERALDTRDAQCFAVGATALGWEGHAFSADACADTRAHLLRSVGSCSFEEPVAGLRALGWWPFIVDR